MLRILFNIIVLILSVTIIYSVYKSTRIPSKFRIESKVDIEGSLEDVYVMLVIPTNWDNWQPWRAADPKFVMYFEGPASGSGAQMMWSSKRRGSGLFNWGGDKILDAKALSELRDQSVAIQWVMDIKDFGGRWACDFELQRDEFEDGLVHVTWRISGDRVPLERPFWFLFSLDDVIRGDMVRGLANLKKVVESDN